MAMSFVKVYFDFEERTEMLNEVEQGRLLLAMLRYAEGKELPELKGGERFLFPVFKIDIDRDTATYNAKVSNGAKGGRPKHETEENLTKPNETEDNLNAKNKNKSKKEEQEQDKGECIRARTRFTPPTVEEVAAYAAERGYTGFSAERFIAYYESNGWRVGRNPMKDWRAAIRNWASKDKPVGRSEGWHNPALDYEQRDYSGTKPKPKSKVLNLETGEWEEIP